MGRIAFKGVVALLALATAGCAVGPNFKRPAAPDGVRYTASDLPAETAARRRAQARAADRFESEDLAFFERVRSGYAARMAQAPQRFARIDSSLERGEVWRQIRAELERRAW